MASTINDSRRQTELDIARDGVATRVFLQPIAAPSILGLFGFAGATFIVASNMAGWWGTPTSGLALAPFAAMFGGLAQFLAGMWAYRAREMRSRPRCTACGVRSGSRTGSSTS
ncbi:MAG TPA: GPR1/FUN34/YaaH family transporter [Gaiellaceae bacterium]